MRRGGGEEEESAKPRASGPRFGREGGAKGVFLSLPYAFVRGLPTCTTIYPCCAARVQRLGVHPTFALSLCVIVLSSFMHTVV